jgi:hypothetical protein
VELARQSTSLSHVREEVQVVVGLHTIAGSVV